MKKKMLAILLIITTLCLFFAIAACENKHSHTFSDEWTSDGESHWHASTCEHDEVKDKAAHSWDDGAITTSATCEDEGVKTYTCKICSATKIEKVSASGHKFSDELSMNAAYHWYAATCGHNIEKDKAKHVYIGDSEVCDVCDYESSKGLVYAINADNGSYTVMGLKDGNTNTQIVIPIEYKGLPVTGVGVSAFEYEDAITSVEIPDSVVEIANYAFRNCSKLKNIDIPGSVVRIGTDAFADCANLESIKLSSGLQTIGIMAFRNCSSLKEINIPQSVTFLGSSVFESCNGLEVITVDQNNEVYKSQGNCVIERQTNVLKAGCKTSVIPNSVTEIAPNAFHGAGLKSIVIPASVTTIGNAAFSDCVDLINVEIPISVVYIGTSAFGNCTLAKFYCEASSQPSGWNTRWKPTANSVEWGRNNISTNSDYDYVKGNNKAYLTNYKGTSKDVEIPDTIDGYEVISIGTTFAGKDITSVKFSAGVTEIADYAFDKCNALISVTFSGNSKLTSVGVASFRGCENLASIKIPNGVTIIGNSAFDGCIKLTSVVLPDSVTSIGNSAFSNCSALGGIAIPANVIDIGNYAFKRCTALTSMTVNGNNKIYKGEGNCILEKSSGKLLFGCKGSIIPSNVTIIENSAFSGCDGLINIVIPNSVTTIGEYAFEGCSSLTSLVIPKGVTTIKNGAFSDCSKLASVDIQTNLTSIGTRMFQNCTALTEIEIPNSVNSIDYSAFEGCTKLENVVLPTSVTNIGQNAFSGCVALTNFVIPSSVESIGAAAFSGCTATNFVIPLSVKTIGANAFGPKFPVGSKLKIYCQAESQPSGWNSKWYKHCDIVWGYVAD
ncbi:MAG: leucine-rich repeat domain-containing protein [Clostridia bacterium]|nr:leucine-rich repeat domain-containing protein [Clostridia bacterium]